MFDELGVSPDAFEVRACVHAACVIGGCVTRCGIKVLLRDFADGGTGADGEEELYYEDFINMFVHLDEPATRNYLTHI